MKKNSSTGAHSWLAYVSLNELDKQIQYHARQIILVGITLSFVLDPLQHLMSVCEKSELCLTFIVVFVRLDKIKLRKNTSI